MKRTERKGGERGKKILRIFCILWVVAVQLALSACDETKVVDSQLDVKPTQITLTETGKATIYITSNTIWEIIPSSEYLSFSANSGKLDGQVEVSVTERQVEGATYSFNVKTIGGLIYQKVILTEGEKPEFVQNDIPNKTFTVNGVSFKMIGVTGGIFQMGATPEQGSDADSDELPVHEVQLSSFYIGQTEVTQELWEAVMGKNPSYYKGAKHPVEEVSWNDCMDFIKKLNQLTGMTFRLPKESEWEFAARGGTKSKGYKYAGSDSLNIVAWYEGNSYAKGKKSLDYGTHDVATKLPNELGVYDMSGNVIEWCSDYKDDYKEPRNYPPGSNGYASKVVRGGDWISTAKGCRVSWRDSSVSGWKSEFLGFRLAL